MTNLKEMKKRASSENEILLIDILLEAQDMNESIKSYKDSAIEATESLNSANEAYINMLNEYTEIKKKEISEFFNIQLTQIIIATKELNSATEELKKEISRKKGFLNLFKK